MPRVNLAFLRYGSGRVKFNAQIYRLNLIVKFDARSRSAKAKRNKI
ncbi:hypothetical protein CSUNSWCD_31 [Campylobacter showae CSUNSWCD]|uniref:Uncharacterized protein n=1 Tax=Campylobacter showae CSUNSWCD TaxID=1244083 RepID=M5IRZ9_9BACT|nr:hypothetical protein CSUNSWCD_31 [Campylobacter showae CSUNSWCD]